MAQDARARTFSEFSAASAGILFATDVAARGLDLPAVDCIIQYDPPEQTEDYVHRAGRTARMGRRGEVLLFLRSVEHGYRDLLASQFKLALSELTVSRVLRALDIHAVDQKRVRLDRPPGLILQQQFERLAGAPELFDLAKLAYQSFVRAYAAFPKTLKSVFHPKRLHLGHLARAFGLRQQPSRIHVSKALRERLIEKRPARAHLSEERQRSQKRRRLNASSSDAAAACEVFGALPSSRTRRQTASRAADRSRARAHGNANGRTAPVRVRNNSKKKSTSASAAGGRRRTVPLDEFASGL